MSISKNQIKLITSLSQKKYRQKHQLFVVEGIKSVHEFLNSSCSLSVLYATESYEAPIVDDRLVIVSESELKKISTLKSPNKVVAIFKMPEENTLSNTGLQLALDGINDPGNLGTIIRLCDWFGVQHILCSPDTVDCYNPKVVQASMGSLSRVQISYLELETHLKTTSLPVFIADMEGSSLYKTRLPKEGILVMGNEANGISEAIQKTGHQKICIPSFGKSHITESLNVATATAILLSEFRRG